MKREAIQTDSAPKALGPYSQAVRHGSMLFVSGQLGLDPVTNHLVGDDIESQINQVLANVEAICVEAGTSIQHALKLTLYLQDLSDFAAVNQALEANLTAPYPARATTQVAGLPLGALIEIDAIVAVHGE
ncbi:MAG: Rid family detoxifying hydrolase [Gammaproteobacteria bacterium]